jgi:hypothetical protein
VDQVANSDQIAVQLVTWRKTPKLTDIGNKLNNLLMISVINCDCTFNRSGTPHKPYLPRDAVCLVENLSAPERLFSYSILYGEFLLTTCGCRP